MIVTYYALRCDYCGKETDVNTSVDNLVERYRSWQEGKWDIETQEDLEKEWDNDEGDCPKMDPKSFVVYCGECIRKHQI